MTDKKQPEALRLAALIEKTGARGSLRDQAAVELCRQYAEIETLRAGYEAARLEIESLRASHGQAPAKADEPARRTDAQMQKALMAYLQCTASELENYSLKLMDGYTADVQRILAAITPAPVGVEPVARLEIGKTKGGVSLTHIAEPAAFQLPEGMYALYTAPQPAPAGATEEVENLRKALVYVAFALHDTPQYMLAQGITLIYGDTVCVSRDGWTVEASSNPLSQSEPQPSPTAHVDVPESEYRRGYRHGYEQRDAEVRGALV